MPQDRIRTIQAEIARLRASLASGTPDVSLLATTTRGRLRNDVLLLRGQLRELSGVLTRLLNPTRQLAALHAELEGIAALLNWPLQIELTRAQVDSIDSAVQEQIDVLEGFRRSIDRVAVPAELFNPGTATEFARSIATRLIRERATPLHQLRPFYGSGIYAIFYRGIHPAYRGISGLNIPIYVGKAESLARHPRTAREQGQSLFKRLAEHAENIRAAEAHRLRSLRLQDFTCRYLVLDHSWHAVAELLLIRRYHPVWNKETKICQGFGKHGDDFTTRNNRRSSWDTLHPARGWAIAAGAKPNKHSARRIIQRVRDHCARYHDLMKRNPDGTATTDWQLDALLWEWQENQRQNTRLLRRRLH